MNGRRIFEIVWGADEWITDHVFQPIADWLADHGITIFHAARVGIAGFYGWAITDIVIASAERVSAGKSIADGIIIVAIIGLLCAGHLWLIRMDERGSQSIWVRPRAFVVWWGGRVSMLMFLGTHIFRCVFGELSWIVPVQDSLYLFGMYMWACRPRPPSRRHASAPASSNTERAS